MAKKQKHAGGRPTNPKALTRVGTPHTFWLDEVDEQTLQRIRKHYKNIFFVDLMRQLIRDEAQRIENHSPAPTESEEE